MERNSIAFFDFDGTITTRDSLVDFIKYAKGKSKYFLGLVILSPMLTMYQLKIIPNYIAKEMLISYFFKGWDLSVFEEVANSYSLYKIDEICRPKALAKINWHKERGHIVVIVSASIDLWLEAWCRKNGLVLLATGLSSQNNKLDGKFSTKNCYGLEKVSRIKKEYNLDEYQQVYAYGDSKGDKELLSLADEAFYKPFR